MNEPGSVVASDSTPSFSRSPWYVNASCIPSRESACAIAHAIERLLATPKMIPVFPSSIPMTLELLARPAAEVCGGIVCRLEEIHQRILRRSQPPHRFVRQQEFT